MATTDTGVNRTAYDTSIFGGTDSNGAIVEVWGKDAISNAILMWLTSAQGDVLRNPTRGGVLLPHLTKPMTESRADTLTSVIYAGIKNDFEPFLVINSLLVTPLYDKRKWLIELEVYSPEYKVTTNISTEIKNLVD